MSHWLKAKVQLLSLPFHVFDATVFTGTPPWRVLPFLAGQGGHLKRRSSQKLPLAFCLWAPGSWQHVLARPSSVGCPERHLGPSPLATQGLAQCPLPTDGSWLNWMSLEWLMDSLYQNLTVLHKMFLPVLHIIHYRSGCSVLWVLFFSISHNASRNICLTITSLMGFMCAFANTGN